MASPLRASWHTKASIWRPSRISSAPCIRSCSRSIYVHANHVSTTGPGRLQAPGTRSLHHASETQKREDLKEAAKQSHRAKKGRRRSSSDSEQNTRLAAWELTVGIEIHARLNAEHKLFSHAPTALSEQPNENVAYFDLALPGAQPQLQSATLLPALRAAIALNCQIQPESRFDRKHYFYHDQPAGYQITQFYAPFAKHGSLSLDSADGIADDETGPVHVGIRQVQLEQDTAKTVSPTAEETWLDFNRAGQPLIEIITQPDLHHPATAAACVRKIQRILLAVSAVTTGMELGGLRADVNVSLRRTPIQPENQKPVLGQRTEIKNLGSVKAVEDAIVAERDRQIRILEAGGQIEGETRGWSLGATETRKLRSKEGEVDYRYMPDPDLAPLYISRDLVEYIRGTLPTLPTQHLATLAKEHEIVGKDAAVLAALDDGDRLEYFYTVLDLLRRQLKADTSFSIDLSRLVYNWAVHELGAILTKTEQIFTLTQCTAEDLAGILTELQNHRIDRAGARHLLQALVTKDPRSLEEIIAADSLAISPGIAFDYDTVLQGLVDKNPTQAAKIQAGQRGVEGWFVGQILRQARQDNNHVDPAEAQARVAAFFRQRS